MMTLFRKLARFIRYVILVVLAFSVGAIAVLTLTSPGRETLAEIVSGLASSPGQTVRISGIDGIWSGYLTADTVVLEDGQGPWLALRGVAVDWSPLALFSNTFRAERVAVIRVEVARAPVPPKDAPASDKPASLPLSIDIKAIDLPDIALGSELVGGRVASISAGGSLRAQASPLIVETDLAVRRTDSTDGDLDAKIDFAPADNRLSLDIRSSEPSGGIIAGLLGLPGKPSIDILASGSGPAADWNGKATFSVDKAVVTTVTGSHRLTDAGSAITIAGDGEFSRFLPQRFRTVLDGKTNLDIAGTLTKTGGVVIDRATIEGTVLAAKASGSVDPEGATDLTVEVAAAGSGLPLSFGTDEAPIDITVRQASVRAVGKGNAPALDIAATLPSVETNDVKLTDLLLSLKSDGFDIATRVGPVTGSAAAAAIVIDNPTVAPLVAGKVSAEFNGALATDALRVDTGSLRSDAIDGSFSGTVSLADGAITLNLKAAVLSAALPEGLRPALGEGVAIAARLVRDAQGNVSAEELSLQSGGLSAGGTIRVGDGQIDADLKGGLADVAPLAAQAKGAVEFSATAKGAISAPDVAVTLTGERITVADREIAGLELTASGKADAANPQASLALKGTVGGQPLAGNAVLKTADGKRSVEGLSLTLGTNKVSGNLALDDRFVPTGAIDFTLPDIGPLATLALETAEGDLSGSVTFSETAGVPQASVTANSTRVARGDVSASKVAVKAQVANYLAAPAISGSVRADEARSGTTTIRAIAIDLSQDGDWTRFAGGADVTGTPVKAAGRVKVVGGTTTVELASGEATVRGIKAALGGPTTVKVAGGQATLANAALSLGGGSAVISGTAGTSLNLNVTLSRLPGSLANNFAPTLGAAGTVSGTVKVTGPAATPTVGYTIDWTGAETTQTRSAGFGAMTIRSSGTYAGSALKFDASVGEGSGLAIKGGGTVTTAGTPQLNLDFSGPVPFAFLTRQLAAQGLALTGTANVSLQISGAATAPVIGGSVRTSGARFVDARSGIAVDSISAEIALGGGVATVSRLSGTLSTGGSVSVSGTVGSDAGKGFPANLAIRIADGRYTDGQVVTTTLSADLALKGALVSAPVLTGTINLARTVITVPERLPGSLAALDVQHRNAPAAVQAQDRAIRPAAASSGGGSGLSLDVTVNAPQQIFIRGRGLDAELGGSLRLVGPVASPQATGQFTMRRGRLSVLGKRLTFTRGTLGFAGSLVPYLDLAADSTSSGTTVTVLVTGPANNPKFTFASVPSLPEDEILARLIFGRSMSNLSPIQIAQLAEAAAQFAGVGGNTSLLETLRGKLGVDDLDIKTDDQGRTAVSVGKYLNERTYITIEKGDKAGSGRAAIDLDIGRGVKLRGEARDDGEAKGGIFFEREY